MLEKKIFKNAAFLTKLPYFVSKKTAVAVVSLEVLKVVDSTSLVTEKYLFVLCSDSIIQLSSLALYCIHFMLQPSRLVWSDAILDKVKQYFY